MALSTTTAKVIWQNSFLSGGINPYDVETDEGEIWQSGLDAREHERQKKTKRTIGAGKQSKFTIATTDFETDPAGAGRWIEPFAWGFYDGTIYHEYWGNDAASELVKYIRELDTPHIIYAHNGGKFDFQFIVEHLERDILFIGSRIVLARIAGKNGIIHEIRDSLAIIPVPLKDAAEKLDFDYAKMEAGRRDRHRPEIMRYLRQDCVGLHETVMKYRETFGNTLTMASAAMRKLNEAMCPEGHPAPSKHKVYERLSPRQDSELRNFYYGGRVQCFQKGIIDRPLKIYDINSSYPFSMMTELHPVGAAYEITREITQETDFALIEATSKGCLPIRAEDGSLAFPVGRNRYHATIHEIKAGLETGQLTIHRVLHARQCRQKTTFAAFIEKYYALRMEAREADDDVFALFWKLVMNGAYGKFAQNPLKFRDRLLCVDGDELPSVNHGWKPEYLTERFTIYSRKTEEYFPGSLSRSFLNVGTGASITGAARAHLMRGLASATGAVYCDTDSIICEALPDALQDAKRLGAWKLEAEGHRVAICEKKMYAFFGPQAKDPKINAERKKKYGDATCIKVASKGVRLSAADILTVARGETVEYMPLFPTIKPDGRQIYTSRKIRMAG